MENKILIGGSLAANQCEGAWDVDGKGVSIADLRRYNKNLDRKDINTERSMTREKVLDALNPEPKFTYPKRFGIDFYNNYESDIDLIAGSGANTLRISMSWTRIFPTGDEIKPNQKGLDFYRKLINKIKSKNMTPIVTISHYDMPYNLVEKYGGWKNKKLINIYLKYCEVLFKEFKDDIEYWIPFNEINAAIYSPWAGAGLYSDEEHLLFKSLQAMHNLFVANALCIKLAKSINKNFKLGSMVAVLLEYPKSPNPIDVLACEQSQKLKVNLCFDVMSKGEYPKWSLNFMASKGIKLDMTDEEINIIKSNTVDFNSFSYYMSGVAGYDASSASEGNLIKTGKNPHLKSNEWGWQIDPVGLRIIMNKIYYTYNKPIMIAENGIGFVEKMKDEKDIIQDDYRIEYLSEHLKSMFKAINEDGVNCIAYTMWTPIDIISHGTSEMSKRYGLIYVDLDDDGNGSNRRFEKKSYKWFKDMVDTNWKKL